MQTQSDKSGHWIGRGESSLCPQSVSSFMAQRRAEFPEPATRDHRSEGTERARSGSPKFCCVRSQH